MAIIFKSSKNKIQQRKEKTETPATKAIMGDLVFLIAFNGETITNNKLIPITIAAQREGTQ